MSKTAYNEAQALTKSTMQKTKAQSLPTTQIAFRWILFHEYIDTRKK